MNGDDQHTLASLWLSLMSLASFSCWVFNAAAISFTSYKNTCNSIVSSLIYRDTCCTTVNSFTSGISKLSKSFLSLHSDRCYWYWYWYMSQGSWTSTDIVHKDSPLLANKRRSSSKEHEHCSSLRRLSSDLNSTDIASIARWRALTFAYRYYPPRTNLPCTIVDFRFLIEGRFFDIDGFGNIGITFVLQCISAHHYFWTPSLNRDAKF